MFDRYNESARRVLFFSRYEAGLLGNLVIDSEHLLLGLLREPDAIVRGILDYFGVDPVRLRAKFPMPESGHQISSSAEMPLSRDAMTILEYAVLEAERMGSATVRPDTLLLAILRLSNCNAAQVLADHGLVWSAAAEVAGPIIQEASRRSEKEELTPIVLRGWHYDLLDAVAENIRATSSKSASRQELVHAVFDALADTSIAKQSFGSVSELRDVLRDYLRARWPVA